MLAVTQQLQQLKLHTWVFVGKCMRVARTRRPHHADPSRDALAVLCFPALTTPMALLAVLLNETAFIVQVIPGNETKVAEMLNSLAMQGARVMAGRTDNLHVSGHAYQVR